MNATRSFSSILMAVPFVFVMGGCDSKINDENFGKISPGMTQSEVDKVLGKGVDETPEGTSISGAGIAGGNRSTTSVFRYKDGKKAIVVTYKDGKVMDFLKAGF